jgi:hypothetical protein
MTLSINARIALGVALARTRFVRLQSQNALSNAGRIARGDR